MKHSLALVSALLLVACGGGGGGNKTDGVGDGGQQQSGEVTVGFSSSSLRTSVPNALSVPITLNRPADEEITVQVQVLGSLVASTDYTIPGLVPGTTPSFPFTFHTGQTSGTIFISFNSFASPAARTMSLMLASVTTGTATVDDNKSHLSILFDEEMMMGSNTGTISVTRQQERAYETESNVVEFFQVAITNAPTQSPVAVSFTLSGSAVEGTDYTVSTPSPVSIFPGSTTASIRIQPINDTTFEHLAESLTITLTGATTGPTINESAKTATAYIIDDDGAQLTPDQMTVTVPEGAGPQTVTVHLPQALDEDLVLGVFDGGTAQRGVHYTITESGTVTIPAGQTSASVHINVLNDGTFSCANRSVSVGFNSAEFPSDRTAPGYFQARPTSSGITTYDITEVSTVAPNSNDLTFLVEFAGRRNLTALLYDDTITNLVYMDSTSGSSIRLYLTGSGRLADGVYRLGFQRQSGSAGAETLNFSIDESATCMTDMFTLNPVLPEAGTVWVLKITIAGNTATFAPI